MNILSWNVRGADSANYWRTFRELVNIHHSDVVILIEIHVSGDMKTNIISSLGFQHYVKVDAMGFARGIWVL